MAGNQTIRAKPKVPLAIRKRRVRAVHNCTEDSLPGTFKQLRSRKLAYIDSTNRAGIAFSGGGIRSATISLGFTEALAVNGRLCAFDMMSTVSGGGYFGSFLRSLFQKRKEDEGILTDRAHFADAVLHSLPDTQYFRGKPDDPAKTESYSAFIAQGKEVKNPLWWLRENGRYLAPNGATDYGFAIAYAARNWLTLAAVILVLMMVLFGIMQSGLIWLYVHYAKVGTIVPSIFDLANVPPENTKLSFDNAPLSPLLAAIPPLGLTALGIGLGYWFSLGLREQKPTDRLYFNEIGFWLALFSGLAIGIGLAQGLVTETIKSEDARSFSAALLFILPGASLSALWSYLRALHSEQRKLSFDFRREQTRVLSYFLAFFLTVLIVAVVDSMALSLRYAFKINSVLAVPALSSAAIASVTSWLIAKLPEWLSGKSFGFALYLKQHGGKIAFAAGAIILMTLAVAADLLVIRLAWDGQAWERPDAFDPKIFGPFLIAIIFVALVVGSSTQLLNLISFTPLYTSRLIRTYLGASNAKRMDSQTSHEITQGMAGDELELRGYMAARTAAPLHLINVTVNRTVGSRKAPPPIDMLHDDPLLRQDNGRPRGRRPSYESQLVLRDRQGDRMVIGPHGIRGGTEWMPWANLQNVEVPPVGQFCGISGAAVSSGMGRHSSLGKALAFTVANIRLGQWWRHGTAKDPWWQRPFHSFFYLFREMFGKYSRDLPYWYLSDGGHSENSGALSLIERGCNFVVVLDNGQDEKFQFADLEIFVRTARTDIGIEVEVFDGKTFPKELGLPQELFFNGGPEEWRETAKGKKEKAFALLLEAKAIPFKGDDGEWTIRDRLGWIIWIKPSLFDNLPTDIATYAELNAEFPQQSTSNQFFDEAQWESYRRLGFAMGKAMFGSRDVAAKFLPFIKHRWN